jgi:hypothetical protein
MYEDNNTTKRGFFNKGKLNGVGLFEDRTTKITQRGSFQNGVLHGKGFFEDRNLNITRRGFFHSGLLEGQGVIEDKKNKITKRGNFKGGKLFGLGEVKWENGNLWRGQFGPARGVKHNTKTHKYVTEEDELLQGTAIIKQGSW